jgi:hypothetical protein
MMLLKIIQKKYRYQKGSDILKFSLNHKDSISNGNFVD